MSVMNSLNCVFSGFPDLDGLTGGLWAGDLIVLAGSPDMGKTALALNIAEHVARKQTLPVAIFSMDMGVDQIAARLVGLIARTPLDHLRTGKLTDDEWSRLSQAIEKLGTIPLHIDETPGLTSSELRANARRLSRQYGQLGLIVVDYLHLMGGAIDAGSSRNADLSEVARELKMLAKELKCPILALSRLNPSVETRSDKRPMVSDLRAFGAIERYADIIMLLYRDHYYTQHTCEDPGMAEITICKLRNGSTGSLELAFLEAIACFESVSSISPY